MPTKANTVKKRVFIEKMKKTLGNITASCEAADIARDNSKGVQDIIRLPEYQALFPGTMPTTTNSRNQLTDISAISTL